MNSSRWSCGAVMVLVLIGFALRWQGFGEYFYNPDEGIYWAAATTHNFFDAGHVMSNNVHPPFHFFILWILILCQLQK